MPQICLLFFSHFPLCTVNRVGLRAVLHVTDLAQFEREYCERVQVFAVLKRYYDTSKRMWWSGGFLSNFLSGAFARRGIATLLAQHQHTTAEDALGYAAEAAVASGEKAL